MRAWNSFDKYQVWKVCISHREKRKALALTLYCPQSPASESASHTAFSTSLVYVAHSLTQHTASLKLGFSWDNTARVTFHGHKAEQVCLGIGFAPNPFFSSSCLSHHFAKLTVWIGFCQTNQLLCTVSIFSGLAS